MLICSPAFVIFPVFDLLGGFRKEILLFAVLSVLSRSFADSGVRIPRFLPALIGIMAVILVLSHEMMIVFMPYVICVFLIHGKEWRVQVINSVFFMMPAAMIVVFLVSFHKVDKSVITDICRSLGESAPFDCLSKGNAQGAISFLGMDTQSARYYVSSVNSASTLRVYVISAILAFTPIVLKLRSERFRNHLTDGKARIWLTIFIVFAFAGSIPLLWVAADYGRIIHIHATCLSLLMLMATQETENMPLRFDFNLLHIGYWSLCLLFVISWRLIHWKALPRGAFRLKRITDLLFSWM
jgi:uncharacterized membrane protein